VKTCSKCKLPKDETQDFYIDKRRDKPSAWCKKCHVQHNTSKAKEDPAKHNARSAAWRAANRDRANTTALAWYHQNAERVKKAVRSRKYKIDFPALWEAQGGLCACCGGSMKPEGRDLDSVCVDHDRSCCPGRKSCGKCVRGLVHWSCNLILGYAKDGPKILRYAAEYVERVRS
jgi:hypothetical protein